MPEEPKESGVEPVRTGGEPLGESGTKLAEPTEEEVEPSVEDLVEPDEAEGDEPEDKTSEPQDEESFIDLKDVPPELQPTWKKMQGAFTKKMQGLADKEKELEGTGKVDETAGDAALPPNPDKEEIIAYMQTPQGSALRSVFQDIVREEMGDLPRRVMAQDADKEIAQAVSKFGKEMLDENYEAIDKAMKEFPTVPLDMVCASILYPKAKDMGKAEFRKKLAEKRNQSFGVGGTSPVVTDNKPAKTIDEAFQQAVKEHGE
jgi:hypothetical protein